MTNDQWQIWWFGFTAGMISGAIAVTAAVEIAKLLK